MKTAEHIILDCERLGTRRSDLFGCQKPVDESDSSIRETLLDHVLRARALAYLTYKKGAHSKLSVDVLRLLSMIPPLDSNKFGTG